MLCSEMTRMMSLQPTAEFKISLMAARPARQRSCKVRKSTLQKVHSHDSTVSTPIQNNTPTTLQRSVRVAWLRPARKILIWILACAHPRLRTPQLHILLNYNLYSNIYLVAQSSRNGSSQLQGTSHILNAFSKTGNSSLSASALLLVAVAQLWAQLFHQIFVFFDYLFLQAYVCMCNIVL
jgi:hypothetical protein